MVTQSKAPDDGAGWIVQLVVGVGMLLLVTVGKSLIASQSAITAPVLWIAGLLAIGGALYSRLAPKKKPVREPPRDQGW